MADSTTVEEEEENEFLIQQYNVISLHVMNKNVQWGYVLRYISPIKRDTSRDTSLREIVHPSPILHPSLILLTSKIFLCKMKFCYVCSLKL